ncbi:MAG TPA: DUF3667 domain-containing protein [Caulobacteraceae bacterium]|jgi:hypothetical protein
MAREIEAGAAWGVASLFRRRPKHALPLGEPCPNCATALQGPWCHACGQAGEEFHRSLFRLAGEALEGVIDVDGRLWQTLPDLILNPARLTRRYLDGHRAPQAPPFRTFLIVVVLVFLTAGLGAQAAPKWNLSDSGAGLKSSQGVSVNIVGQGNAKIGKWLSDRLIVASKHPEAFQAELNTWAQRLVFLALPISALLLGLVFFWKRGVFMFDHLIFSMHSLSFQGLLLSAILVGVQVSGWFGLLAIASPIHLFVHLKGTYGIGVVGTLARMLLLLVGSLIASVGFMTVLFFIGLYEVST